MSSNKKINFLVLQEGPVYKYAYHYYFEEGVAHVVVLRNSSLYFASEIRDCHIAGDILTLVDKKKTECPNPRRVIFCGYGKGLESSLGADVTFSDMDEAGVLSVMNRVKAAFDGYEFDSVKAEQHMSSLLIFWQLVKEHRYCDAREHCQIFSLDYDELITAYRIRVRGR